MLYNEILQKMEVAWRYYTITNPDAIERWSKSAKASQKNPKAQALKQFQQDKNIDLKVLKSVIREIAMDLIKETRSEHFVAK